MKDVVLITGGSSGIGLALAKRYLADGNRTVVCGRNAEKLRTAEEENPGLETILCDVGKEADRLALFDTVKEKYPNLNVLINNAGIQQRVEISSLDWELWKQELAVNLEAPVHLCGLFVPFLAGKEHAQIVNVSSGLAFRPPLWAPIYGATKAAVHSFTFVLREQVREKGIAVTEIIPPAVNTNLGGRGRHTGSVDLEPFADSVYRELLAGKEEIGYAYTNSVANMTRAELEAGAVEMAKMFR